MNSDRLKEIGLAAKPYGYKGGLLIRLTGAPPKNIEKLKSLFLLIEGRAVPFITESVEYRGDKTIIVLFKWYDTVEKVIDFTGCKVLVETSSASRPDIPDHELLEGLTVVDEDGNNRGVIISVTVSEHQWLATVKCAGRDTFLLPVHEDLISNIDFDNHTITMVIPDGIEDI
jgi:16S rRNA processing protein RimM